MTQQVCTLFFSMNLRWHHHRIPRVILNLCRVFLSLISLPDQWCSGLVAFFCVPFSVGVLRKNTQHAHCSPDSKLRGFLLSQFSFGNTTSALNTALPQWSFWLSSSFVGFFSLWLNIEEQYTWSLCYVLTQDYSPVVWWENSGLLWLVVS